MVAAARSGNNLCRGGNACLPDIQRIDTRRTETKKQGIAFTADTQLAQTSPSVPERSRRQCSLRYKPVRYQPQHGSANHGIVSRGKIGGEANDAGEVCCGWEFTLSILGKRTFGSPARMTVAEESIVAESCLRGRDGEIQSLCSDGFAVFWLAGVRLKGGTSYNHFS